MTANPYDCSQPRRAHPSTTTSKVHKPTIYERNVQAEEAKAKALTEMSGALVFLGIVALAALISAWAGWL